MNSKWIALVTVISLTQAPGLLAQRSGPAFDSPVVASNQQIPGERSSALAGTISGLSFGLGLGSFYAGNSGHGVTHLAVAAISMAGMMSDGGDCAFLLSFGATDSTDCTLVAISAGVFMVNWIWSITTAASDAREHNIKVRQRGLQVAPELVAVGDNGQATIGLQVLRFGF